MIAVSDAVHSAQRTFRALLQAFAHPGRVVPIDDPASAPAPLAGALGAAALALFDDDVAVWLAPSAPAEARAWLAERTRCRFVDACEAADFAVVLDPADVLPITRWRMGSAGDPETSATLLVCVDAFDGERRVTLRGPGIESDIEVAPGGVTRAFWDAWAANADGYPLGIDVLFIAARAVVGLPRTARAVVAEPRTVVGETRTARAVVGEPRAVRA